MNRFEARRISDPVHGTVGLSELEIQVINTRPFQRLRQIKQLGLGHYVFPGADYSRFAHSIGVCHVAGRELVALRDHAGAGLTDDDLQLYRLAALLHDIGHYPFSHAMEDAIGNTYAESMLTGAKEADGEELAEAPKFFGHERVSEEVVLNDPELVEVLKDHDAKRIAAIFTREEPLPFANLVSSDLDADRVDYLLRTAHHTGLPYGTVDLDYIISQLRLDDHKRVCLTSKAVRAADHFLLSRYFDYQQVAFHKTVAALELLLKDVLQSLIRRGLLDGSAASVSNAIKNQSWFSYDDGFVIGVMRTYLEDGGADDVLKRKIGALLARRAPKLICEREYIADRSERERESFLVVRRMVREHVAKWAKDSGIEEAYWYVWDRGMSLTKIGGSVPLTALIEHDEEDEEALEQTIRILGPSGSVSKPIVELNHSLMKNLSNSALYALRVYALLPDTDSKARRERQLQIEKTVRTDLPEAGWK